MRGLTKLENVYETLLTEIATKGLISLDMIHKNRQKSMRFHEPPICSITQW